MATMLMPPTSPAAGERVLRIPPIAANLLPVEVVEGRRSRRIRRLVLILLAVAIVVLGAWFAATTYQTRAAREDLARAEADAARMQQQQKAFGELLGIQAETLTVTGQLTTVMTNDMSWTKLLNGVRTSANGSHIRLTGVNGGLVQQAGTEAGKSASGLPNTADAKVIGKLTLIGVGPDKTAVAGYLNKVAKLPGVANPLLTGATQVTKPKPGVQFTITVDLTADALGGRFAKATGQGGS